MYKEKSFQVQYDEILLGIIEDLKKDMNISMIATKFHNTICQFTIDVVSRIAEKYEIYDVILSGGVFENNYLLETISFGLQQNKFQVFHNEQVPINDSGVSFGQVAVAQARCNEEE